MCKGIQRKTKLLLSLFPMDNHSQHFVNLFIYLFLAVLGLHFCARAFSSCGERGPLFIAVRGPLTVAASLVAEHRLQTHRLSNCGSRAQLLRGMWDLPRPGLEPVSPALAGRFLTTAPPGKPTLDYTLLVLYFVPCRTKVGNLMKKKTKVEGTNLENIILSKPSNHGGKQGNNLNLYQRFLFFLKMYIDFRKFSFIFTVFSQF